MPLFGQLNYGALYPARRAFGLDQFLPADQEMARRGYPVYGADSASGSDSGAGTAAGFGRGSGSDLDFPMYGLPLGPAVRDAAKGGYGAPPPVFPLLGPQTTRRTQLFGPLANLSAPRLL